MLAVKPARALTPVYDARASSNADRNRQARRGGVPGLPGVEGEQQPPLVSGRPQVAMGFQLGGDLIGQGQGGFSLPGPGEQVDGQVHGQVHGLVDQRVLVLSRLGPGEPEECLQQLPAVGAARLAAGQLIERRPGHVAGGGPVAEVFQAADQPALHAGEPAAVAEIAADPVRGLPGHHAFHRPGAWILGHLDGLGQHRGCQRVPFACGERSGLLGETGGGRNFDTHQLYAPAASKDVYPSAYMARYGALVWNPLPTLPKTTEKYGRHLDYAKHLDGQELLGTVRRGFAAMVSLL
jgi:hypothetical protein